jgi:hypothetical protein
MECAELMSALEEHLRAQLRLIEGFRERARVAGDPRLKFAWLRQFVRVSNAMAETGNAMARLKWAPDAGSLVLPALLPACAADAFRRGGPTPFQKPQNNLRAKLQRGQRVRRSCRLPLPSWR